MRTLPLRLSRTSALATLLLAALAGAGSPSVLADEPKVLLEGLLAGVGDDAGAYLGVHLTEETEHPEGGARVSRVVEDSPAEEAGLQDGDIIVQFGGKTVRGPLAVTRQIRAHASGDRVPLQVLRDGRVVRLEVELGQRPEIAGLIPDWTGSSDRWQVWQGDLQDRLEDLGDRLGEDFSYSFTIPEGGRKLNSFSFAFGKPKLGVQLIETTPELREHLGGSEEAGVLVSKVLSGTPAERAGIRVGDLILSVDGESVATVDDLRDALQDKQGQTFAVRVVRDQRTLSIQVTIPAPDDDRPTGPQAGLIPAPPAPPPPVGLRAARQTAPPARPAPVRAGTAALRAPVAPPAPPAPPAAPAPPPPPGRRAAIV